MAKCGRIIDPDAPTQEADGPQPGPEPRSRTTVVRYGKMGRIGEFVCPEDAVFTCGGKVVISTERGIEVGEHVGLTCCACDEAISPEEIRAYVEASSGGDIFRFNDGRILREASEADLAEFRHIEGTAPDKRDLCQRFAEEISLNMKIVECEQLLGGERIVFYFMAEERIDFRQLVRRLAAEFQTRIEMRQIGARDEARLLADYETCGRECCCKNFLKNLKPVGMAMAKLQKTTLDVAKVSGRCGRLKCCLRYEHETYEVLDKNVPRNGMWLSTKEGLGRVVDRQILTQLVKIKTPDGRVLAVAVEDILERNVPPPPPPEERESNGTEGPRPGYRGPRRPTRRTDEPKTSPAVASPDAPDSPDEALPADTQAPREDTSSDDPPVTDAAIPERPADESRRESDQRRGRRPRRGRRRGPDGDRPQRPARD